jgi:hypothetical protein
VKDCFKFLVVIDRDTERHVLMHPYSMLSNRQARYLRDLQPFVGTMSFVYPNGAQNEVDPLISRRIDFVAYATVPIFWDGEVPSNADLRWNSQPLLCGSLLSES